MEEVTGKKKKQRKITDEEWEECVRLRKETNLTTKEIAEKFNFSVATLNQKFSQLNIKKGENKKFVAEAAQQALKETAERAVLDSAAALIARAKIMEEQGLQAMQGLQSKAIQNFIEHTKSGRHPSAMFEDQRAIGVMMKNLQMSKEYATEILSKYEDMGEDDLPYLEIREMTDDDVEELREEQRMLDEEMGDGGEQSYANVEQAMEEAQESVVEISPNE